MSDQTRRRAVHFAEWLRDAILSGAFGDLNFSELRVLLSLWCHADADGCCYPGRERIATPWVIQRGTIYGATRSLQEKGYITIEPSKGGRGSNGRPRTTRYRINPNVSGTLTGLPVSNKGANQSAREALTCQEEARQRVRNADGERIINAPVNAPSNGAAVAADGDDDLLASLKGELRRAGIKGKAIDTCAAVAGLTPTAVRILARQAEGQAKTNPAALLVSMIQSRAHEDLRTILARDLARWANEGGEILSVAGTRLNGQEVKYNSAGLRLGGRTIAPPDVPLADIEVAP